MDVGICTLGKTDLYDYYDIVHIIQPCMYTDGPVSIKLIVPEESPY